MPRRPDCDGYAMWRRLVDERLTVDRHTLRAILADWCADHGHPGREAFLRHPVSDVWAAEWDFLCTTLPLFVVYRMWRRAPGRLRVRLHVPDVLARFAAYRLTNPVWGALHVTLEDGNLDDDSVWFCRAEADAARDGEGVVLADLLFRLTKTQRARVAALAELEDRRRRLLDEALRRTWVYRNMPDPAEEP